MARRCWQWGRFSLPSPVFTRAGSNLPPSRGKALVGAERAIFIVMTRGWDEEKMGPRIREDTKGRGLLE